MSDPRPMTRLVVAHGHLAIALGGEGRDTEEPIELRLTPEQLANLRMNTSAGEWLDASRAADHVNNARGTQGLADPVLAVVADLHIYRKHRP